MMNKKPVKWLQMICMALALFILAPSIAEARATARTTVRPKTYRQYLSLCRNRPDIPACRRAAFYFGKLSRTKSFYNHVRLHLALRKARRQQLKMKDRMKDNSRSYWRRMWSKVRFKMVALRASMFHRTKIAAAVAPAGPFHNTGGFGHHVQRSSAKARNSWVYKRGRLRMHKSSQNKAKPLKRKRPRKKTH